MCQFPKTYTNRGIVSTMQIKTRERKNQIEEKIRENTDSIDKFIKPGDLRNQNIDSWDDVNVNELEKEIIVHSLFYFQPGENLVVIT